MPPMERQADYCPPGGKRGGGGLDLDIGAVADVGDAKEAEAAKSIYNPLFFSTTTSIWLSFCPPQVSSGRVCKHRGSEIGGGHSNAGYRPRPDSSTGPLSSHLGSFTPL